MDDTNQFAHVMRSSLAKLGRRGLSRHQLLTKLEHDGCDAEVCRRVLGRLGELGLIDDEALGRFLITQICRHQPAGPQLIESKLLQHGIDPQVVARLVEANFQSCDTLEQASELVRRQWPAMAKLDGAKRIGKLWALLARRGYDEDTIEAAMRQWVSET